jgi:hypothetical protein
MAFNPFAWFRKHQKVAFAILTIVCMITFVLCGGSGLPVFRNLAQNIGEFLGMRPAAAKVTTLYGKGVTRQEVDQLRLQRSLAQEAFSRAFDSAIGQVRNDLKPLDNKFDEDSAKRRAELEEQGKQVQRSAAHTMLAFRDLKKLDSLLDFMVWRHQADQLGIHLTDQDVEAELKRRTAGRVDLAEVERSLAGQYRANRQTVLTALKDEFRVGLVQAALVGYAPENTLQPDPRNPLAPPPPHDPINEVPADVTPYEFLQYVKDQRTALRLALLPVPVPEPTTGGQLSDADLREMRALFDTYKNQEPTPGRAEPGFKVPRRVRVEWVGAQPDSPALRDKAKQALPALGVAGQVGAGGVNFAGGGGLAAVAVQTALPLTFDLGYLTEYERLKQEGRFDLAAWTEPGFALSIYTSMPKGEDAATAVGTALGAAGTQATPLAAAVAYQAGMAQRNAKEREAAVAREREARLPFGAEVVLAGLDPFEAAAVWHRGAQAKQYLPPDAARAEVVDREYDNLARALAVARLREFYDDFKKHSTKPAEARDWLAAELPKYDVVRHEAMAQAEDQFAIDKDPALKPLKDSYAEWHAFLQMIAGFNPRALQDFGVPDLQNDTFAALFFDTRGEYKPMTLPGNRRTGEPLWGGRQEPFVYWKTEDKDAYVPEFDAVKDKVEAAWRTMNARSRTRKEVDALEAKARAAGGDLQKLRDLAAEGHRELIELDGVARQAPQRSPTGVGQQYAPYKFPDTLPYPKPDWLDKLMALKQKGDVTKLSNEPEKTFYVAVLLDRTEPSVREVQRMYREGSISVHPDPLRGALVQEEQQKYRDAVVKQLRIDAGADADGNYQIDPEARKQLDSRGGDTEE